jgi:phenylalanine-4-hydroxylase
LVVVVGYFQVFFCLIESGDKIPSVEYTEGELQTWKLIYEKLVSMYPTCACKEHREAFHLLEKENIYTPDKIPQLEDVSNFLKSK